MYQLHELVKEYLKQHPKAQSPLTYIAAFGIERLISIIKKSKGREIIFSMDGIEPRKISFTYQSKAQNERNIQNKDFVADIIVRLNEVEKLQSKLIKAGELKENKPLQQQVQKLQNDILKKYGLPANKQYRKIVEFGHNQLLGAINTKITLLNKTAKKYLIKDAISDLQLLKKAREQKLDALEVFAELKIAPHIYNSFLYQLLLMTKREPVENILAEFRLVNGNPDIMRIIGELEQTYVAQDIYSQCEWGKIDYSDHTILYNLDGEEISLKIEDVEKRLQEKGVRYLYHLSLYKSNVIPNDDEIYDQIS